MKLRLFSPILLRDCLTSAVDAAGLSAQSWTEFGPPKTAVESMATMALLGRTVSFCAPRIVN